MDIKLISQLQEADLFPAPSSKELKGRKAKRVVELKKEIEDVCNQLHWEPAFPADWFEYMSGDGKFFVTVYEVYRDDATVSICPTLERAKEVQSYLNGISPVMEDACQLEVANIHKTTRRVNFEYVKSEM